MADHIVSTLRKQYWKQHMPHMCTYTHTMKKPFPIQTVDRLFPDYHSFLFWTITKVCTVNFPFCVKGWTGWLDIFYHFCLSVASFGIP